MADPNLSELVTTTLRKRNKKVTDNVSNGNSLLQRLNFKGKTKPIDGGRTIVEELAYQEATFQYYSGYEVINLTPKDVFSAAEYNWKQGAVPISGSGLELDVQNTGPAAAIKIMAARTENGINTMRNNVSTGIFSDGTGTSGKQITGLQALVADAPSTGTVGGINRANFSFWRNQNYDFSDESVAAGADTITAAMQALWIDCTRGPDKPDLVVSGKTYYQYFWESLTDIQRITRTDRGISGFDSLAFGTADVVYDDACNTTRMYMLNTNYIYWRPHVKRNMIALDSRQSINQDAVVVLLVFAANMGMSWAAGQGVMVP